MKTILNVLWFLTGGLICGLLWFLVGLVYCMTIIGIPIGTQCFKCAKISFAPFGKEIQYGGGAFSCLANVIWFFAGGLEIAILYVTIGLVFCISIIGIPVGVYSFKMAKLALSPFGATIVS